MTRGPVAAQTPPITEVDAVDVVESANARRRCGQQVAENPVHHLAVHAPGRRDEAFGRHEMTGTALVYDDFRVGEGGREVTDAAGVIEVDVRHHDRREISGTDAER